VVSALILVMCVIRHSLKRAVFYIINIYIAVSVLMSVMCVIWHSVDATLL